MSNCLNKRWVCLTLLLFVALCTLFAAFNHVYIVTCVDDAFRKVLDEKDSRDLIETLRVLSTALDRANVTYMLLFGTLIGAYRHHGMIPWDDDIDIIADVKQKSLIREALLRQQPKYRLQVTRNNGTYGQHVWKFYRADGYRYIHQPYRWPYIDLAFFSTNATHVNHDYVGLTPVFNFKKSIVFPLQRRPFETMLLPVPCETENILRLQYNNLSVCKSLNHNHRYEIVYPGFMKFSVSCSSLKQMYPFVDRKPEAGSTRETLRFNQEVIHSHVFPLCRGGKVVGRT